MEIAGSYKVVADAGRLPANQLGIIRIRIHNVEEFDLPISHATASCGCTKAELMDTKIPAKGHADLVIKIKTPDRASTAQFFGQIRLHIDKSKVEHKLLGVDVVLKFGLDNLLCFTRSLVPVSVASEKPVHLELPFVCTVKTPLDKLKIETTEAFDGIQGSIKDKGDGIATVSLLIDPSDASTRGEFGKLTIIDPASGLSDSIDVVMYRQERVTISPRTLRFARSDDDTNRLTAHAVVRIQPSEKEITKSETPPSDAKSKATKIQRTIHGEAYIDGVKLKTKFSPMTGSISRAEFSMTNEQWQTLQNDKIKDFHIDWTILANGVRAAGKAPVVVFSK